MTVPVTDASEVAALSQAVHRLSRRLRKRADLHLTASQISALTTVERHGELRLGELARLEQIGKSTMTRLVAVQAWPVSPNPAMATKRAARSRSASASTIVGFLPPISS